MNDEFVTMVKGEDTTVEQYTKEIRGTLESQAVVQNQSDKKSVIMDELMKHVELLKYPKNKVQKYKDQMTEQYQQIATSLNMEFADFLEQYMGMDEDTFKEELDSQIKEYVKQQEVLDLIAKEEKITVSENEISEWLDENAQAQQMTVDDLKSQYSEDEIKDQALANKVISWLWDKAEVTRAIQLKNKEIEEKGTVVSEGKLSCFSVIDRVSFWHLGIRMEIHWLQRENQSGKG